MTVEQEWLARLTGLEQTAAANTRRIDRLEKGQAALNRLATAVEVLATKQESIGDSVERLGEKMDTLERRPAQRWEGLTDKVLAALAGAFAAWLLAGGSL